MNGQPEPEATTLANGALGRDSAGEQRVLTGVHLLAADDLLTAPRGKHDTPVGGLPGERYGQAPSCLGRSSLRRSSARAVIPAQRYPDIEVVDALTKVAHLVSADELVAGQPRGSYQGLPLGSSSSRRVWSSLVVAGAEGARGE